MKKYLVLPRLEFRGATGSPLWWVAGCPGPSAALGLGNYLALETGGAALTRAYRGAALVMHDFRYRAETIQGGTYPHQLRAAVFIDAKDYAKGLLLSSQPTIRCDGVASLILAFDESAPVDTVKLEKALGRARFAGGSIIDHGFMAASATFAGSLADACDELHSGFGFHDRQDLITPRDGEPDPLAAFLRATRRPANMAPSDGERTAHETWLMPYLGGYRAMGGLRRRPMAREGYPSAYAEPLAGLGQLISLRDRHAPLWVFSREAGDLYLYRQQRA